MSAEVDEQHHFDVKTAIVTGDAAALRRILAEAVGTGLKRSHFHRFEGKHWVPVFEVRRHECVGSMKKEPAVLQSQV